MAPSASRRRAPAARSLLCALAALCVPLVPIAAQPAAAGAKKGAERTETATAPGGAAGAQFDAAPDEAAEPGESRKHPETLWEFALAGGPVIAVIAACSLVWVTFLVERIVSTRRARVIPPALTSGLGALAGEGRAYADHAARLIAANPSPAASVLRAGLERLGRPREELERAVQSAADREVFSLRKNVRLFAVIASIAPLLGLLGTVTGMIWSFREVAMRGLGAGREFAPGIYEALTNTAAGLIVAIPALLTYYWFGARVDALVHRIDGLVEEVVTRAEKGVRA